MNGEALWDKIVSGLSFTKEELQTTTGLWFKAYLENNKVFIDRSVGNSPSSNVTKPRPIIEKDFLMVHSYYERWINGEKGIRHEVSRKSRNTAYIFALLEKFGS